MIKNPDMSLLGELLIESSVDAMIAIERDGRIITWNKSAYVFFNIPCESSMGKQLTDVLPSIKNDPEYLTALKAAKEGRKFFLPSSKSFFHRQHVETHVIPLKEKDSILGVMLLIHDVSHRIAKETELENLNTELQKRIRQLKATTRELGQLTHITTHNIKEPIRTIYTSVEFLVQSEAKSMSNSGRASFRRIQSALTRMSLLLDDIITLTQIDMVEQPESMVNLDDAVNEVTITVAPRLKASNVILTSGELCEIRAHRNQVILMLQHILSNAIKFNNSEKPVIHIDCRKLSCGDDPDCETYLKGRSGEYYLLLITHNGFGFKFTPTDSIVDQVEGIGEQTVRISPIASIITAKVMEASGGVLAVDTSTDGITTIRCYFPVKSQM